MARIKADQLVRVLGVRFLGCFQKVLHASFLEKVCKTAKKKLPTPPVFSRKMLEITLPSPSQCKLSKAKRLFSSGCDEAADYFDGVFLNGDACLKGHVSTPS